jgi:hypothetical protein
VVVEPARKRAVEVVSAVLSPRVSSISADTGDAGADLRASTRW